MRLKRLVVHGFKSFADKTEFDFDANLTGIVGPNGCGKSNVVDALKWVLGDQRAKSLRGTEMTDVIFKGAEGRSAMHEARVSVVLEDPSGKLDGRTDVTIGRRLTSDKESEYLLNDEGMRLKDVRDLLMDTGLGVGAYSVMEQGRIDAVLSANPEERRSIFEEAAGISRFKLQKRETLRKLERTEQNLARAHDLIEERTRRIRGLKIQAGKARRFQELSSQLRDLRAALAVLEARALRVEQARHADLLQGHAQALQELEGRRRAALETLAAHEEEIARLDRLVEEVGAKIHAAESDKRSQEERAESLEMRAEELRTDGEQSAARAQLLESQREERNASLAGAQARVAELEQQIIGLQDELAAHRDEVKARQQATRELVETRERARELVMERMRGLTALRNKAHGEEAEKRSLEARRDRLLARAATITAEIDALLKERLQAGLEAADLGDRVAALRGDEERATLELTSRDAAMQGASRQEAELRVELSACTSQMRLLDDMAAHMEGLDEGPRSLLAERPPGLVGSLSELLEIDVDLSPALEAALGPFLQALIVDTRANADAILERLKAAKKGRAILLVRDEFDPDVDRLCVLDLPEKALFLAANVRCDAAARPIVNWLLRGVCLVDSLADASADRQDLMFVTRDGSLSCGPRLEGGVGEGQGGVVVQKALRHRLESRARELEAELATLAGEVARAKDAARETKEHLQRCVDARATVETLRGEAETRAARVVARLADLEREHETQSGELAEVQAARHRALAVLGQILMEATLAERGEREAAAAEAAASQQLAEAQQLADQATAHEQEIRVRTAASQSDRDGAMQAIRMHEQALRDLERAVAEQLERKAESLAGCERALGDSLRAREQTRVLVARLEALGEERDARDEEVLAARRVVEEEKRTIGELESRRAEVSEAITQERLALGELEHKFTRVEERLREDAHVELLRCLDEVSGQGITTHDEPGPETPDGAVDVLQGPPLPEAITRVEQQLARQWDDPAFDPAAAATEASVLQGQLDRLGPVNLDAVRELAQEEQDYSLLEAEVADLTEARKSLIEALRRMEAESRVLFETTFEKARQNFKAIFRKLFQGGHADMTLTAPKRDESLPEGSAASFDALECGIEIVAKPPGKELQSINLLSGGERSLTALAILFAVFKVKPSPFCILDEVDAALDETNVERFLRVLRDFVGETQFCIVTHHKRTMAECQVLYGISMQKKGVSSRIAVALSQVDELHAGNVVVAATPADGDASVEEPVNRIAQTISNPLKQRIAGEEPVGF